MIWGTLVSEERKLPRRRVGDSLSAELEARASPS